LCLWVPRFYRPPGSPFSGGCLCAVAATWGTKKHYPPRGWTGIGAFAIHTIDAPDVGFRSQAPST
jgi:hypothetical protein